MPSPLTRNRQPEMLEALAGGLLVAALSGLTLVAYRHPHTYARWAKVLSTVAVALVVVVLVWNTAALETISAVAPYFDRQRVRDAYEAGKKVGVPLGWLSLRAFAFLGYLLFLLQLPKLLRRRE